jgi:hypothetical protein
MYYFGSIGCFPAQMELSLLHSIDVETKNSLRVLLLLQILRLIRVPVLSVLT